MARGGTNGSPKTGHFGAVDAIAGVPAGVFLDGGGIYTLED